MARKQAKSQVRNQPVQSRKEVQNKVRNDSIVFVNLLVLLLFAGCKTSIDSEMLDTKTADNLVMEAIEDNITSFTVVEKRKTSCEDCYRIDIVYEKIVQHYLIATVSSRIEIQNGTIINVTSDISGYDGEVVAETDEACNENVDCFLPVEYAARSDCPYYSVCLEKECKIFCPNFGQINNRFLG